VCDFVAACDSTGYLEKPQLCHTPAGYRRDAVLPWGSDTTPIEICYAAVIREKDIEILKSTNQLWRACIHQERVLLVDSAVFLAGFLQDRFASI
jgi:hypothetical protein